MRNLGVHTFTNAVGTRLSVLDAQADQGFAHVSETACHEVLVFKGKAIPPGDEDGQDRKTILAIACIAAIKPDLTDIEAAHRINLAFIAENPNYYGDLLIDPDSLAEVVEKTEAKTIAERAAAAEVVKAKKTLAWQTRHTILRRYFKAAPVMKYSTAQKKQPRWLPPRDEKNTTAITKWIKDHAPESVTIVCDDYNGRWRVISADLNWRSVSWTKRGFQKAALEVVHQAWLYECDSTGRSAPFDLGELEGRFAEESAVAT